MNVQEFNNLLRQRFDDKVTSEKFYNYCLKIIKKRLLFRNGLKDWETLAHSILVKFMNYVPDRYISAPITYINSSVDKFLSTMKQKVKDRETELTADISYEQRFKDLEKVELFRELEEHLSKLDAYLMYAHCVEKIPEKELAEELNISYASARQRICRAKKQLKTIYNKDVTKQDKGKS